MKGTDSPRTLRVVISIAVKVTLLVEPGHDLDLADHADWCEVRFIKTAP